MAQWPVKLVSPQLCSLDHWDWAWKGKKHRNPQILVMKIVLISRDQVAKAPHVAAIDFPTSPANTIKNTLFGDSGAWVHYPRISTKRTKKQQKKRKTFGTSAAFFSTSRRIAWIFLFNTFLCLSTPWQQWQPCLVPCSSQTAAQRSPHVFHEFSPFLHSPFRWLSPKPAVLMRLWRSFFLQWLLCRRAWWGMARHGTNH